MECYFTYFGSTVENSKEKFSHPNKFFSKGDSTIKAPLIIKGKDNAKIQNAFSKSAFEIAHNSGPFNLIPVLSAKREWNILKCPSNCYWNTNSTPD